MFSKVVMPTASSGIALSPPPDSPAYEVIQDDAVVRADKESLLFDDGETVCTGERFRPELTEFLDFICFLWGFARLNN